MVPLTGSTKVLNRGLYGVGEVSLCPLFWLVPLCTQLFGFHPVPCSVASFAHSTTQNGGVASLALFRKGHMLVIWVSLGESTDWENP